MTLTELRSDWDAQIPFSGPRIVSLQVIPQTLLLAEGGVWARDYKLQRKEEPKRAGSGYETVDVYISACSASVQRVDL